MEEKIIKIDNTKLKEMELLKEEYLNIKMSEEQLDKLKKTIEKGKKEQRAQQRKIVYARMVTGAAAIIAAFILLPNTSPGIAYAMEKVPILGELVRLVTWREYIYEDDTHLAEVNVEKIEVNRENEREVLENTTEEINANIEEVTDSLIAEFKTHMEEEQGYHSLAVESEVIASNEDFFTLKLLCFQAAASGYEWAYFYTIDMHTGERVELKDLFLENADYITVISEDIKKQMKERMEVDENVYYWLEDEIEELNFSAITEETAFYLNGNREVVISFNEGEVAPMYMGMVEFIIPNEVVEGILK